MIQYYSDKYYVVPPVYYSFVSYQSPILSTIV